MQAADGAIRKLLWRRKNGKTAVAASAEPSAACWSIHRVAIGHCGQRCRTPDGKLLEATLKPMPIERPAPGEKEQHCAWIKPTAKPYKAVAEANATPSCAGQSESKKTQAQPGRRKPGWIVEWRIQAQPLSPLASCVGEESFSYLILPVLPCAIICWCKCEV